MTTQRITHGIPYTVEEMISVVQNAIMASRGVHVEISIDTSSQREMYLLHLAFQRVTGVDIGAE